MPNTKKRYALLIAYVLVLLPTVLVAARKTLESNANSPLDWVPASFGPRHEYDRFCESFGSGDVVVIGWPGCTVDEPRLDLFADLLRKSADFYGPDGHWYFDRVITGREVLGKLTAPPLGLPRDEALRRLRGSLVGPDASTTCVLIGFTPAGLDQREKLVARIREAATQQCGVSESEQHLAGPVIDGLSVDRASRQTLLRLAWLSAAMMFLACWWSLGSLRAAGVVFGISLYGQAVSLALIHYGGERMNAILIVLPPLIQILAVTGGIHLVNYYFEAARTGPPSEAGKKALLWGWLPSTLSAATTAVGLASLMLSDLTPIRSFGAYGAAGVMITAGMLLALVPGALTLWPIRAPAVVSRHGPQSGGGWQWMTGFLARRHAAVVAVCLLLMAGLGYGARFLKTSVRIETLFAPGARILDDYDWLEEHVGLLVPIEVTLRCEKDCSLSVRERFLLLWRIQQGLASIEGVGSVLSPMSFLPDFHAPAGLPAAAYDLWIDQVLAFSREQLASGGYLHRDPHSEQWRVTAYVSARKDVDYGAFLDRVRDQVVPLLRDASGSPLPGVSAACTGVMPLVHAIQHQLLDNLFSSFLAAFVVIAAVMTLAQAGLVAGLAAMLPNIFPALLMFGWLGWMDAPMDIGSVMTASIALGIAVDDTLHYLTFFRRGMDSGMNRPDAVAFAYGHCGRAMIQTSVTCGLGLIVFSAGDFLPTSRFAWLMVAQLAAALAGDLVLMPALLLGPMGRFFHSDTPGTEASAVPRPKSAAAFAEDSLSGRGYGGTTAQQTAPAANG
ncbi:MAG: MMPL family transporter [Pirellulales bacterium]|nr:MMPL family transporter [Pirellulales bacterium]